MTEHKRSKRRWKMPGTLCRRALSVGLACNYLDAAFAQIREDSGNSSTSAVSGNTISSSVRPLDPVLSALLPNTSSTTASQTISSSETALSGKPSSAANATTATNAPSTSAPTPSSTNKMSSSLKSWYALFSIGIIVLVIIFAWFLRKRRRERYLKRRNDGAHRALASDMHHGPDSRPNGSSGRGRLRHLPFRSGNTADQAQDNSSIAEPLPVYSPKQNDTQMELGTLPSYHSLPKNEVTRFRTTPLDASTGEVTETTEEWSGDQHNGTHNDTDSQ